jgi:hypothetical protein
VWNAGPCLTSLGPPADGAVAATCVGVCLPAGLRASISIVGVRRVEARWVASATDAECSRLRLQRRQHCGGVRCEHHCGDSAAVLQRRRRSSSGMLLVTAVMGTACDLSPRLSAVVCWHALASSGRGPDAPHNGYVVPQMSGAGVVVGSDCERCARLCGRPCPHPACPVWTSAGCSI